MKQAIKLFVLAAIVVSVRGSCSKDAINTSTTNDVLVITPELLVSYVGKNYTTIVPQLKNKKDYWYTALNNTTTLAAISLPAVDPQAPALHYKLTLNTNLQNIISVVHLDCTDTIDTKTGNQLLLYYYNKALNPMQGVYQKLASYIPTQPPPTVNELLAKLNALTCPQGSFSFSNPQMNLSAACFSNPTGFSFNGTPF